MVPDGSRSPHRAVEPPKLPPLDKDSPEWKAFKKTEAGRKVVDFEKKIRKAEDKSAEYGFIELLHVALVGLQIISTLAIGATNPDVLHDQSVDNLEPVLFQLMVPGTPFALDGLVKMKLRDVVFSLNRLEKFFDKSFQRQAAGVDRMGNLLHKKKSKLP